MSASLHSSLLVPPPKPLKSLPTISSVPTHSGLRLIPLLLPRTLTLTLNPKPSTYPIRASSLPFPSSSPSPSSLLPPSVAIPSSSSSSSSSVVVSAGRSKKPKKGGGGGGGRIEGGGDVRREAKANARRRSRRLAENLFYRRHRPAAAADSFTEEELEMIGLGYDRSVRFMSGPDDPNLRHPHDWYKYGRFGPYSWRGIVVGPPIRGRFSDDRVSLISEVRDHEEWDKIEQFDLAAQFSRRLAELQSAAAASASASASAPVGFRYYWVFVRHPRWRPTELPWRQWTLVAEVAVEAAKHLRIDKWSLMGRLGNRTRAVITQCAAWMRPDVIYVKRPVYQCRFELQDGFFRPLGPLLDPDTERHYLFQLDGAPCTYFGGLCRLVKASPKAYVDDVVNAYERLSEDAKSRCLEFLLTNHPTELLHPYTKEWKVKLEEMELGCDAPDESDDDADADDTRITDWIEDDEETNDGDDEEDEGVEEDEVIDAGEGEGDGEEEEDAERNPEESEEYWNEQWKKAVRSPEEMEKLVKRSVEVSTEYYKSQMREEKEREERMREEKAAREVVAEPEQSTEGRESGRSESRKRKVKSKIPPELFLRAAVRPFTYRNLVKEIVLMRHAIIDGDISGKG